MQPAPPEAMMGTAHRAATASSISRSKPFLTPSVSMELTTSSPAPFFHTLFQPVQGVDAGVLPAALGEEHEPAVYPLDVGGEHHALVAVLLGRRRDDAGVGDGSRVDADLIGAALEHPIEVLQRADAAAHRQRDEDLAGHLAQNVGEEGSSLPRWR